MYALHNVYWAAHNFCKPFEVMFIVDGDDSLIGRQVFKIFNAQMQR